MTGAIDSYPLFLQTVPLLSLLDGRSGHPTPMADRYKLNVLTGRFDNVGAEYFAGEEASAPTGQADGYMSVVDDTLYYFAGGNRYKITAALDNPAAGNGTPIGLLLVLTREP